MNEVPALPEAASPAEALPHDEAVAQGEGVTHASADETVDPEAVDMAAETPAAAASEAAEPPTDPAPSGEAETASAAAALPELSAAACGERLAALFPALFAATPPKPVKLRIQADIQQRAPGIFSRKSLSLFLHRHTTSTAYLKALAVAAERIDLDGQPAGPIADEHREAARVELERRRARHDERRAAERAAQREAQRKMADAQREKHQQERQRQEQDLRRQVQEREEQGQARAERAALLRAFEATTLTRANFCALKRIAESELDAQLAQAREERDRQLQALRAQRPSPAAQPVQPGHAAQPAQPAHGRPPRQHPPRPSKPQA